MLRAQESGSKRFFVLLSESYEKHLESFLRRLSGDNSPSWQEEVGGEKDGGKVNEEQGET